jgi:hypothetical protein
MSETYRCAAAAAAEVVKGQKKLLDKFPYCNVYGLQENETV